MSRRGLGWADLRRAADRASEPLPRAIIAALIAVAAVTVYGLLFLVLEGG